jgi:hypothetical protein
MIDVSDDAPVDVVDCVLTASELLAALAAHEREAARLALAIRRLELSGDWGYDGSVSIAAWLRTHGRLADSDSWKWVHRGRFLDRFPAVADAAVTRTLSAGQVTALQHACPAKLAAVLAEQQTEIVAIIAPLPVADTEKACQLWKARAEAIIDDNEPRPEPERSLRMRRAGDGALVGNFELDDVAASELEKAIRTASTWEGTDDKRSASQAAGDALFDVAAFFNKNHRKKGTPRNHPHVELSLDITTLDGRPEAIDDDQRLVHHATTDTRLCDCVIHRILRDADNMPTGYGRASYTVPRQLFRQIAARDGGCRMPDCNRSVRHCDAHHIHYWRNMGLTNLENLVLLCSRHHHLVHRLDLELKLLPSGQVETTWRDGTHRTSQPHGAPPKRRGP